MAYSIKLPDGTTVANIPDTLSFEDAKAQILRQYPNLASTLPKETTIGGSTKEFFKGLVPGAIGLAENAAVGASALLPEDTEKAAREKIKSVATAAKAPFAAAPGYEESVGRKFGEAVGSTIPFLASGPFGIAGRVAATALGVGAGAGEARGRAEEGKADADGRGLATGLGAIVGTTEMFAPLRILGRLADPIKQGAVAQIKRALIAGGEEGAQEAASQIAQNLIAKGIYKPEQAIIEQVGESAAYGGATGALIQGLLGMAIGRRSTSTPSPETVPGAPPAIEAAAQLRRTTLEAEQGSAASGRFARDGVAILDAEAAAQAKADKAQDNLAQKTMADEYTRLRAEREASLRETFPADYSDLLQRTDTYTALAKELVSLDSLSNQPGIKKQRAALTARMQEISLADGRVQAEYNVNQQALRASAKKAGFPAQRAAEVFSGAAPAQMEMREALLQGTLPPQVDLQGNPVVPTLPQPLGLADIAAAELPMTTDVLDAAGIAPTRRELEAAGQQSLDLRRTPRGQPTSSDRTVVPTQQKEIAAPLSEVAIESAAPAQPGAITATEIKQFGTMSKANRTWLGSNIEGRTPEQVRDMVDANPALLSPAPVGLPIGLQTVVKEIIANAASKEAINVQPASTPTPDVEPQSGAGRSEPSVAIPSEPVGTDTVDPGTAATPDAAASALPDGLGLAPAGQPASAGAISKVPSQPALDVEETQRQSEAAEFAAAIAKVRAEAQKPKAERPAVTPPSATPAKAKAVEEAPAQTGSPFDILKGYRERQPAAIDETPAKTETQEDADEEAIRAKAEKEAERPPEAPKVSPILNNRSGRASESVAAGQSLESMKQEIAQGKGMLYSALRRAIASGKVVLEFKDSRGNNGGFFDGRIVTLYADGIPAGQVMSVALHEVGAHMGFKNLFGARVYDNIIKQIQTLANSKTPSLDRTLAQEALQRIPESDSKRGVEVYGDETIAYFIEVATNAQNAGALPRSGPVRALFNNIRLAMLAAINRVFGSKLGVADLSTQDIMSMAEGAFVLESFTAIRGVADTTNSNAGRASRSAAKTLGVDTLDTGTQNSLDAIHAAMPQMEAYTNDGVVSQGIKGVVDARKKSGLFTAFRQSSVDKFATVEAKVSKMFSQGVRDYFGNLNPMVLARQAEDSSKIVLDFFRSGGIGLTKDGIIATTVEEQSLASALTKVDALAKTSNLTYGKAKEYVSTVLEGHRLADIRSYNSTLEQEAVLMESLNRNTEADAKRAEKILMHMTNAEIDTLEAVYQKSVAIQDIQADLNATRMQAIDFMRATGRISQDQADFWKANTAYVPFSRVFEEAPIQKTLRGQGLAVLKNVPKIYGSLGRPVQNVLDAYANRLGYMVEDTMKNYAAVKILDTMALSGYAARLQAPQQATSPSLVVPRLYIDGKTVYFEVQNEYDLLAFQQMPEITNFLLKGLGAMSRLLRTTVTAMPPFALKQVIDDAQRAMVTSGVERPFVVGMKTLYNLPRTFFGELTGTKSLLVRRLEAAGVIGDFDSNIFKPTDELEAEIGAKKRGVGRQIFHRLEQFTKASDLSARLAVYEETLLDTGGKKQANGDIIGGDTVLAQTRARELINFNRKGTSAFMRMATPVIPFFNAYAQGMDVLYRAASGADSTASIERSAARKLFISRVALMTSMGLLYAIMMSDDEDYQNASQDVRDNNWVLSGGFKLPVPRELGFIYKSIPERVVDYFRRLGTSEEQEAMKALTSTLKAAMSAYGTPTAVPALVRPLLENFTNYSFFMQRELEPQSVQGQEPGYRKTSSTSELAKLAGEATNVSPIKIDNLLRGVFGLAGSTTLLATDALINPTRPDRPLYQLPFASIFLYDTIGGRAKNEFYDLQTRASQAVTTYNSLKTNDPEKAEAYVEKNVALLSVAPILNTALKQLSTLGQIRRLLEQGTDAQLGMTGAERRAEIDEIRKAENGQLSFVRELDASLRKP